MTRIFLDPGHGGSDPGAVGNGLQEKNLTLSIATRVRDILLNEYQGVEVRMSRTTDVFIGLDQRTQQANAWNANYFMSIHINAGGGTGFESFVHTNASAESVRLQGIIHPAIIQQMNVTNRGLKRANFAVLRTSNMPAILTENLFIDRAADADLLRSPAYLDRIARGHANGLAQAFNLQRRGGVVERFTAFRQELFRFVRMQINSRHACERMATSQLSFRVVRYSLCRWELFQSVPMPRPLQVNYEAAAMM